MLAKGGVKFNAKTRQGKAKAKAKTFERAAKLSSPGKWPLAMVSYRPKTPAPLRALFQRGHGQIAAKGQFFHATRRQSQQ